ncbi:MAG: rhodanese-like domain-containing protein [Sandaracinaceae bacterium]|nr:rhodanese-like domain-containing protein [Sandaracinaceae bacterium]
MIERIGPLDAKRRIDEGGYAYLDVRSVGEFEQGHPNGAYNVPLLHMASGGMVPNPDFLGAIERAFERDAKLILGCQSGVRSLRAAEMLLEAGFTHVLELRPGYGGTRGPFGEVKEPGWHAAGLPTSTEAATGRSWEELGR